METQRRGVLLSGAACYHAAQYVLLHDLSFRWVGLCCWVTLLPRMSGGMLCGCLIAAKIRFLVGGFRPHRAVSVRHRV